MKEAIIVFGILAAIGLFMFLVAIIADKAIQQHYIRQDHERRQAHPELYRLFDAVDQKGTELLKWRKDQIHPKKKQIDDILAEIQYYTLEEKNKKELELEVLRFSLSKTMIINDTLEKELKELRKQVKEYITKHDIKWAESWAGE